MKIINVVIGMVVIALIDSVWLSTVGRYSLQVAEKIQQSVVHFRIVPAIIVYLALAIILYQSRTFYQAVVLGGATYAVYDFTTLAIMTKYEWILAAMDTIWGGVLMGTSWKVLNWFGWF